MSKDLYRSLCAETFNIPIFSRDWWLDIVCGDDWDVLLYEKNGKLIAAMPLYIPCKGLVSMPQYTQTMGVWFAPDAGDLKYSTRLARRQEICKYFIEQLSTYRCFLQNFCHEFTDWLPFYWAGYSQTTRYTYILNGISDSDSIWPDMSAQTRRNIKKARDMGVKVSYGDFSVEDFLKVQALTFERQHIVNKQSDALLRRLITVAREQEQGEIFGGFDEQGRLHAVVFVVWQDSYAYYIAGGSDPLLRHSGAHSLVMWEAIQYASQYTSRFDFEGSMIPGVERFFREFGALQKPYFSITRGKPGLLDRVRIKYKLG